jgi:hypothetical protein
MERLILFAFDEQGEPTDDLANFFNDFNPDATDSLECDECEEETDIT